MIIKIAKTKNSETLKPRINVEGGLVGATLGLTVGFGVTKRGSIVGVGGELEGAPLGLTVGVGVEVGEEEGVSFGTNQDQLDGLNSLLLRLIGIA